MHDKQKMMGNKKRRKMVEERQGVQGELDLEDDSRQSK